MVPSTRQIQQQIATVLRHDAEARTLGIYATRQGSWPERVKVGPRAFRLLWCDSPLSAREALLDAGEDGDGLVLLTEADDQSLGADLLARLSRGRVFRLQSWELVRDLFQARDIDPRLGRYDWIADLLVERAPAAGYAPAPGGFLSADEAWRQVLECALGIADARPDALALLEWTLREDASARLLALGEPMRSDVCDWLGGGRGAGRPPHRCLHRGGQGGGLRAARPGLRAGLPGRQPDRPRVVGRRGAARTLHRRPADRAVRRGPMGDGRRGRAGSAVRSRPLARTARPRRPPARGASAWLPLRRPATCCRPASMRDCSVTRRPSRPPARHRTPAG